MNNERYKIENGLIYPVDSNEGLTHGQVTENIFVKDEDFELGTGPVWVMPQQIYGYTRIYFATEKDNPFPSTGNNSYPKIYRNPTQPPASIYEQGYGSNQVEHNAPLGHQNIRPTNGGGMGTPSLNRGHGQGGLNNYEQGGPTSYGRNPLGGDGHGGLRGPVLGGSSNIGKSPWESSGGPDGHGGLENYDQRGPTSYGTNPLDGNRHGGLRGPVLGGSSNTGKSHWGSSGRPGFGGIRDEDYGQQPHSMSELGSSGPGWGGAMQSPTQPDNGLGDSGYNGQSPWASSDGPGSGRTGGSNYGQQSHFMSGLSSSGSGWGGAMRSPTQPDNGLGESGYTGYSSWESSGGPGSGRTGDSNYGMPSHLMSEPSPGEHGWGGAMRGPTQPDNGLGDNGYNGQSPWRSSDGPGSGGTGDGNYGQQSRFTSDLSSSGSGLDGAMRRPTMRDIELGDTGYTEPSNWGHGGGPGSGGIGDDNYGIPPNLMNEPSPGEHGWGRAGHGGSLWGNGGASLDGMPGGHGIKGLEDFGLMSLENNGPSKVRQGLSSYPGIPGKDPGLAGPQSYGMRRSDTAAPPVGSSGNPYRMSGLDTAPPPVRSSGNHGLGGGNSRPRPTYGGYNAENGPNGGGMGDARLSGQNLEGGPKAPRSRPRPGQSDGQEPQNGLPSSNGRSQNKNRRQTGLGGGRQTGPLTYSGINVDYDEDVVDIGDQMSSGQYLQGLGNDRTGRQGGAGGSLARPNSVGSRTLKNRPTSGKHNVENGLNGVGMGDGTSYPQNSWGTRYQ
jgi:hypothetical protein